MDAALRERTWEAMAQTDAIFALEGFEPTPESRVVNAAILRGADDSTTHCGNERLRA